MSHNVVYKQTESQCRKLSIPVINNIR